MREQSDYQMAKEKLSITWERFESFKEQLSEDHRNKAEEKLKEADSELQIKEENLQQHRDRIKVLKRRLAKAQREEHRKLTGVVETPTESDAPSLSSRSTNS